jgi:hypothetical protein
MHVLSSIFASNYSKGPSFWSRAESALHGRSSLILLIFAIIGMPCTLTSC